MKKSFPPVAPQKEKVAQEERIEVGIVSVALELAFLAPQFSGGLPC